MDWLFEGKAGFGLATINQGFRTVLFDIDGVMLSEERYFDGSALTVYELLCSPQYLGASPTGLPAFTTSFSNDEIADIRRVTFANDKVFETVKTRGVNANWDMVYLQVAFHVARALIHLKQNGGQHCVDDVVALASIERAWTRSVISALGRHLATITPAFTPDFASFCNRMEPCQTKADLFASVEEELVSATSTDVTGFSADRALWTLCQVTFQEWYLGDEYVKETHQPGKPGFLEDEVPLVHPDELKDLFHTLCDAGLTLGIATGRPELETTIPLSLFGWLEPFDIRRISTASDVLVAEKTLPDRAPLAKPNPYSYLRSFLESPDPKTVLDYPLPLKPQDGAETLIVGDSIADLLAARAMGCRFAAVLTGLEGERARSQFEARNADYILSDVSEVRAVLGL